MSGDSAEDRRAGVIGVVGEEIGDLLLVEFRGQDGAVDLVLEVRSQVPGHGLEPGHAVDGSPLLDLGLTRLETEHGVLEGHLGGGLVVEVGVDPVRIGSVIAEGRLVQLLDLLLGDLPPPECADEGVGAQLGLAEQFGQAFGGHMASEVHLPEPVLSVDETLSEEEIMGGLGLDSGNTGLVAVDGDRSVEVRQRDLTVGGGKRPADEEDADEGEDEDEGEDSGEDSQEHACAHGQVRAARRAEHLEQCARFLLILRIGCRHESPSAVQNPSAHSISVGPCHRGSGPAGRPRGCGRFARRPQAWARGPVLSMTPICHRT